MVFTEIRDCGTINYGPQCDLQKTQNLGSFLLQLHLKINKKFKSRLVLLPTRRAYKV